MKLFFTLLIVSMFVVGAFGTVGAVDREFDAETFLQKRISYNASGDIEYIGDASPGALTSEAKWRIKKLLYTDGSFTGISFANGTSGFSLVWDNRESYTYEGE